MALLTEEACEVARIIARKYGEQSAKDNDSPDNLEDKLSDVLFVLICIANQTAVNLTEALMNNLRKKPNRDNFRHKNNSKLKKE